MTELDISRLAALTLRFREFHRLSLSRYESYDVLYADYLKTGLSLFGMSVGIISRIAGDQYTILAVEPETTAFSAQDVVPLGDTYCSVVFARNQSVAVNNAATDAELQVHPAYTNSRLEAYLATPIRVNGEIFGTLNFTSPESREQPFDFTDIELIELMAGRIGQILEQHQLDREKRLALSQLRENTVLFESAFEYAAIGMALLSPEGRWLRVNRAVTTIFGYTEDELLAIDFQSLTHPDDLDADLGCLHEMLEGKRNTYRMEKRYFHKNGHEIRALLSVSMIRGENDAPQYLVSQIQDITAQKQAEAELIGRQKELEMLNQRLELLSTTDPLTQLGNRRVLDERLQDELQRSTRSGQPLSVLIVDVDHFKRYNDSYGHPEGDVALRKLADALKRVARKNDVVVRQGGEEFALLLPHTDESGCCNVARRLSEAVARLDGLRAPITISTGGATLSAQYLSAAVQQDGLLVKCADKALYCAKREGRNRHCQAPPVEGVVATA